MEKTDLDLQQDVVDELAFEPSVDASQIGVAAKDGVVTLTGRVDSYAEKIAAERAAKRVVGVKGLAVELEIELPASHKRSDADIAASALNVLAWDVSVPKDAVTVQVENAWLTLEGQVDWEYQKESAEQAVHRLAGVRGVTNRIAVRARATIADVKEKLRETFERRAGLDADHLSVETHDGTVTLRGTVHTWAERDDATRAAFSVPGVTLVENLTTIA
jgi:osmotically-inducible protein OsmY